MILKTNRRFIKPVLNLLPIAIVVWNPERSKCLLNYAARQMTGFTERQLWGNQSIWLTHVHADDRKTFLTAWKRLDNEDGPIICDYNFYPNGQKKMIRLRDNSVSFRNSEGRVEAVISNYTDISDLWAHREERQDLETSSPHESLIRPLVHELRNGLHMIRMGVDFMSLDRDATMGSQAVTSGIERVNELALGLRDYFVPPQPRYTVSEPDMLLTEVVREIEAKLERQGIRVRILNANPLPNVRLDPGQIRNAFKRVMEFCQALLSNGGELEIKAGRKTITGEEYVALQLVSLAASALDVDETTVFQPFLQINGIQVGLSMAIAREILRRHQGQIVFRKESPRRGLITILLKVSSARRHKAKVADRADIGGSFGLTEQSAQQR